MGLQSSKKHFGIAAFAVVGSHTLQGFQASLPTPLPAGGAGKSSKRCTATGECGEESHCAWLLPKSCFLRVIALLPRLASSPQAPSLFPAARAVLIPPGGLAKGPPSSLNTKGQGEHYY